MGSSSKSFVDTSLCEREPIHIPGTIQPHGCVLVTDKNLKITHFSQNVRTWFVGTTGNLIGSEIGKLFDGDDSSLLRDGCERVQKTERSQRVILHSRNRNSSLACAIHGSSSRLIFEFEPFDSTSLRSYFETATPLIGKVCDEIQKLNSPAQILELCVKTIRNITGFDRVLAYRFQRDWHGVVIAESCDASLSPFLGLHFPASDIPSQARRLYEMNPIRLIVDRFHVPTPLVPLAGADSVDPVDLTPSILRSVSPIHLEYLANLGVTSSMSLSLIVDGALWGLIACHHRTAHPVSPVIRDAALMLAELVSLRLRSTDSEQSSSDSIRCRTQAGTIAAQCARYTNLNEGLVAASSLLREWIPAGGYAIVDRDLCERGGDAPDRAIIERIVSLLREVSPFEVFATNSLVSYLPEAEQWRSVVAGVLSIPIRGSVGNFLLLFRPEVLQTTSWAGNPSKSVVVVGDTAHLSPRRSFAIWSQITHLHSLPWLDEEIKEANFLGDLLQKVLQSRIEHIVSEGELLRTRQDLAIEYLSQAVDEVEEISREIASSCERLFESKTDQNPEASRREMSRVLGKTNALASFFSGVSRSVRGMALLTSGYAGTVKEVLSEGWRQYQTIRDARGVSNEVTFRLIPRKIGEEELKIAAASAVCFLKPFKVIADFCRPDDSCIAIEFGEPDSILGAEPAHHRCVTFVIRSSRGVPFSELTVRPDRGRVGLGGLFVTNRSDLGPALAQSSALAESFGGSLSLVQSDISDPAVVITLPLHFEDQEGRAQVMVHGES